MTIELTPAAEQTLREQAGREGIPADQLVSNIVESRLVRLAQFRAIVADASVDLLKTGLTDDEFGDLLERLKHEERGVPYDD